MTDTSTPFVHLHVHTQYSLLDGAIRIDPLISRVKEFGMGSVAITDHGTMFGVIEFYEKVKKEGIKPIIGCECYVAPRSISDKTQFDSKGLTHLVLLAKNHEGYKNLCKLGTIGQLQGFYYRPRIDKELLMEHSGGLIALSACLHGEIPMLIKGGKNTEADEAARWFLDTFGEDNFFLEVQKNGLDIQEKVNEVLFDMGKRLSIPLVATNDCHYLDRGDVEAHEVLLCIQTGTTIHDPGRFKFSTDQLYFKSPGEMEASFSNFPDVLANTASIAERCDIEFDFSTYHFPTFQDDSNLPMDELFEREVRKGFENRLEKLRKKNPELDIEKYSQRLEYEVKVIIDMGFPGYFLIVADFIRFARENNVPVGPGRGSAAGSIVAYSLGITDLDPLEHGLIFERFLNPARLSMPDIDVDFCINGREKVFKYVVDRYGGGEYVAQIITFGKMKSRAVIRDVGRVLDIPLREVDQIAKMIPEVLNISLDQALKMEPKITELAETKPEIGRLLNICRVLEGLTRHASTHAAGVVIGDKPLVEYLPLYRGKNGEVVTQLDMKRVEQIGLIKFDFLGLRNLTVIEKTLSLIKSQNKTPPDIDNLDFDDADTYKLLCAGDTTGVFQLESSGMKELLVRLKPENFNDITALVALYRPGPMESGMIDDYVERKHGRRVVEYLVPELEDILKETYGVIVYQEQVMKIAGSLANYSMADADGLRKAMGKKIVEIMAGHRDLFMKGATENNIPADKAKNIFDLMEKFGGYGFNKSHSAAYALIAYQTAYLKAHYPVEFIASLLTSEMNSSDGVVKYIAECRNHSITVLPPDINQSDKEFTVRGSEIIFGLVAVKNVGEAAIEAIMEEREENGKFTSIFNFCERVDLRRVNKRVVEGLIKCGAFDSTGAYRSRILSVLEDAIDYGQSVQREKSGPQMGLFDMGGDGEPINLPPVPEIDEWDERELLKLEKESLGFYISGHPLGRYEDLLDKFTSANTLTIREKNDGDPVRIGGIVASVKTIRTKRGDLMAFVLLEDMHGSVEITIFSSVYTNVYDLLTDDSAILVQGQIQKDENSVKLLADSIIPVDKAEEIWTASVHFSMNVTDMDKEMLMKFKEVVLRYPGSCQAYIHLRNNDEAEVVIALSETMKIKASSHMAREVNGLLGYDAVETVCSTAVAPPKNNY